MFVLTKNQTMKKIKLACVLVCMLIGKIKAQHFYANISAGIQLPSSKSNSGMFSSGNVDIDINNNYTYKTIPVSFAQGKLITVSVGYKLKKSLGFDLQYGQFNSDKFTVSWTNPSASSSSLIYSKTWNLNPSIVFYANENNNLTIVKNMYGKVGVCFGSGIILRDNSYISEVDDIENY
jgi:hypothetical protein